MPYIFSQIQNQEEFKEALISISKDLYADYEKLQLQCKEEIGVGFVLGLVGYDNEKTVSCVALIENPELRYQNKPAICLAFYECIDNEHAASKLFTEVEKQAKRKGLSYLIGPMNGSTWNYYRFSKTEIIEPYLTEVYHQPYYATQWLKNGFVEIAEYHSYLDDKIQLYTDPRLLLIQENAEKNGIKIRNIDLENFESDIEKLYQFTSHSFANNFLFTPISKTLFFGKYIKIKPVIDPDFILIAEENDEIVALFMGIPDFTQKARKQMIFKTIAKKNGVRYAGLVHVMANILQKRLQEKGYEKVIHAFMHVANKSVGVSKKFDAHFYRAYTLLTKEI
jgi:hypothetical protein